VNCLIDTTEKSRSGRVATAKPAFKLEAFPIMGPQHNRAYRTVDFALLSISAGNTTKTALVTPENPSGSLFWRRRGGMQCQDQC
jgi:hypothetical protein